MQPSLYCKQKICLNKQYLKKKSRNLNSIINFAVPFPAMISLLVIIYIYNLAIFGALN